MFLLLQPTTIVLNFNFAIQLAHELHKTLIVSCSDGICTFSILLPSALVHESSKPSLPVKLNYLIVTRKRTQKGHNKIKLSLFKIWMNIHGTLLALYAQLFLTLVVQHFG